MTTKHSSPFIYLKGIKRVELENVLNFLYNSEAYIAQDELNSFLETAQELRVKGLQINQKDESGPKTKFDIEQESTEIELKYGKNPQTVVQECMSDSQEELADTLDSTDVAFVKTEEYNLVLDTNLELDLQIEQMIEKNEGLRQCKVCGKRILQGLRVAQAAVTERWP